jgi:YebC/PmpR family DNA-binding regulatory protein
MSGHNKWSKIKDQKAKTDAHKSKIFSQLVRIITFEAKKCGGDIASPSLATVIEKAKRENMPKENIERAIKKATENSLAMSEQIYEGYGFGGVAFVVCSLSDNTNRTNQEIKHIFSKNGAALGSVGSALWLFEKVGNMTYKTTTITETSEEDFDKNMNLYELLENHDDVVGVFTSLGE